MSDPDEEFVELATGLGLPLSRLVSPSKSDFMRRHPQHAVVFNATITNAAGERMWWGDVDLTEDEEALHQLAQRAGFDLFVYHEADSRRGFVKTINPVNAVAIFHRDDTLTLGPRSSFIRTPFGRIIWERSGPGDRAAEPGS
jgi:hypothetical protein